MGRRGTVLPGSCYEPPMVLSRGMTVSAFFAICPVYPLVFQSLRSPHFEFEPGRERTLSKVRVRSRIMVGT